MITADEHVNIYYKNNLLAISEICSLGLKRELYKFEKDSQFAGY